MKQLSKEIYKLIERWVEKNKKGFDAWQYMDTQKRKKRVVFSIETDKLLKYLKKKVRPPHWSVPSGGKQIKLKDFK